MTNRQSTRRDFLRTATAAASTIAVPFFVPASALGNADKDGWDLGPFVKRNEPILRPTPRSRFQCPVRGKEVRWEEQNVYNPAAVVRGEKVYLLYRADDRSPDLKWGRTCRISLAHSEDGVNFTRHAKPVLYPDNDPWKEYEWEKRGFVGNTTVANVLVPFKGRWMLYYGAADRVIGLATCKRGD